MSSETNDVHPLHLAGFLFGGAMLGTGIVQLYFSFGYEGGPLNHNISRVGFTGIDNLTALPGADMSVPFVLIGLMALIWANATAWRETGGY